MSQQEQKRRNIVMILSDSLRADFLNAYGANVTVPTPNIDALAENGIVFDNAITPSTVCGPARASILTGVAVSGHDGWTNLVPLRSDVEYFPERLSEAGYTTAAFGTFDHVKQDSPRGFQYVSRFEEDMPDGEYLNWLKARHPEATSCYSAGRDGHFRYPESEHYDRYYCDRATEFIECYSKNNTFPDNNHRTVVPSPADKYSPFFMVCSFLMPHQPYLPPYEMKGRVDINRIPPILTSDRDEDLPAVERNRRAFLNSHEALSNTPEILNQRMQQRVAYCEMICEIDDLVGRIVASLKENGMYDNTTIILTADHGSMEDDYNLRTKGPFPYTPQLFIPLILSNHPGYIGRRDCLCSSVDIGATVLQIAGDNKRFGISRSLIGQADGSVPERQCIMSEFCDSCKTIADKRYTFTYYPFTGVTALYDRVNDPHMSTDLGGKPEYEQIENRFLKDVIDWMILAKRVRIEAHDLVPQVKEGIEQKDPKFMDNFEIAYPISSQRDADRIREAGLPSDFNDFCLNRPVKVGSYYKKQDN